MMYSVEGTGNILGQGQIINFLVNASPPKPLDLVTSNSVGAYFT